MGVQWEWVSTEKHAEEEDEEEGVMEDSSRQLPKGKDATLIVTEDTSGCRLGTQ